jgi:ABC-type transport system involved in multi-copper enzyme maturation permease subunit
MKALLWKDYRINLPVLVFGVALLLAPPLAALLINLRAQWVSGSPQAEWSALLVHAVAFGLAMQLVTVAMLGGNAIAGERADRSAEFLAYLPASRWAIIMSKAVFALAVVALLWGPALAITYLIAPAIGEVDPDLIGFRDDIVPVLVSTAALLFGAAWLGSAFLPTHTLATGFGIAMPLALLGCLWSTEYLLELRNFDLNGWYRTLCWPLGIGAFVAGAAY